MLDHEVAQFGGVKHEVAQKRTSISINDGRKKSPHGAGFQGEAKAYLAAEAGLAIFFAAAASAFSFLAMAAFSFLAALAAAFSSLVMAVALAAGVAGVAGVAAMAGLDAAAIGAPA